MKLTNLIAKRTIKQFEQEQKKHGTEVALYNFVWELAANLFKSIGVKSIKTRWELISPIEDGNFPIKDNKIKL